MRTKTFFFALNIVMCCLSVWEMKCLDIEGQSINTYSLPLLRIYCETVEVPDLHQLAATLL